MDLELVKAFVTVVDACGVTRAAARLHRTQSTVSQQLARLEQSLGQTLLRRDRRGVVLTEHGERYLGYARRLLALDQEARTQLAVAAPVTLVRLGVPEDFAVTRLPALLGSLAQQHPQLRFKVISALSSSLTARLENDELDLVVVKELQSQPGELLRWSESLGWLARMGSTLHAERPLPLVAFPQSCVYRARALDALEMAGIPWRMAYESPNWTGVMAAVSSGLGVSLLAETRLFEGVERLPAAAGLPAVAPTEVVMRVQRRPPGGAVALVAEAIARLVGDEVGGAVAGITPPGTPVSGLSAPAGDP